MITLENQLVESSRALTDLIVNNIYQHQERFDEIMELVYRDAYPVSMRAAWAAYLAFEKNPDLTLSHLSLISEKLPHFKVDGVKRSALKILHDQMHLLDEDEFGLLADTAFEWAQSPRQPIAVRAFSIDILVRTSERYPEIIPELKALLETILPDGSAGLKNKCQKLIQKIKVQNSKSES
ncbi:MAG: hypothetical protein IPM71_14735 [Bacteroidota bacterium]|nr:MAG: hypothetical protein IPM71_14735 [Bacteroidota bacterium]